MLNRKTKHKMWAHNTEMEMFLLYFPSFRHIFFYLLASIRLLTLSLSFYYISQFYLWYFTYCSFSSVISFDHIWYANYVAVHFYSFYLFSYINVFVVVVLIIPIILIFFFLPLLLGFPFAMDHGWKDEIHVYYTKYIGNQLVVNTFQFFLCFVLFCFVCLPVIIIYV